VGWPDGVAAIVNGERILDAQVEEALQRRAGVASNEPRAADSERMLQQLVDEELLLQRAAEVGLLESDRNVTKALARAAMDAAVDEARGDPPSEEEVRAFFEENVGFFAAPRRLRIRCLSFPDAGDPGDASRRAREAATALGAGDEAPEVARRFGARSDACAPDALLPESVLLRQLGPTLASVARALREGEVSGPIETPTGVHVLQLLEAEAMRVPPFESVRPQVETELIRRRGDDAVRALLARLRRRADITLAPGAPRP
jgi:parvulin-like peptidyl-prolyl isomerase